jgi:hypothetical protein
VVMMAFIFLLCDIVSSYLQEIDSDLIEEIDWMIGVKPCKICA